MHEKGRQISNRMEKSSERVHNGVNDRKRGCRECTGVNGSQRNIRCKELEGHHVLDISKAVAQRPCCLC